MVSQHVVAENNYNTLKANLANQLLIQNDAVTPTSTPAQNEQTVNSIYLQTVAIDVDIDSEDANTLYAIGLQCPEDGGISVLRARAMYSSVDSDMVFSDEGCDNPGDFRIGAPINNPTTVKVEVVPNPTDGLVNIHIPVDEVRTIRVLNSLGQQVVNIEKEESQRQIPIDLSNLKSGIYFVQIWNKEILESVEKFSLIK